LIAKYELCNMITEKILVANVKCSGCATTIKNELLKLSGVSAVEVDPQQDAITLTHDNEHRDVIIKRLHALGYPEATEENGLLLQLKSYVSCMVGRVNNRQ
jgi:copper chaperone